MPGAAVRSAGAGHEPDAATREVLERAWACRQAHRPPVIRFDTLVGTRSVSVTGLACGSNCAHCGGHYLEDMLSPAEARRLAAASAAAGGGRGPNDPGSGRDRGPAVRSWLVSGGCDAAGRVPLLEDEVLLEELGRAGRLNLHAGLVRSEAEAEAIARHATAVSFDFVVDDETIEDVYGFRGVAGRDFVRSFELLSAHVKVLPHVLIGLAGGRIKGEGAALRELARLGADGVVLLVLIPTEGSRFAGVKPPPAREAARVLAEARLLFPEGTVQLGCMRPKGSYRAALDRLAVRAGVDRIAVPTPAAVREAEARGLKIVWSEECCVFDDPATPGLAAGRPAAGAPVGHGRGEEGN